MTNEEAQTLLVVRGAIAGLPEDDQIQIKCIATTLRNILKQDERAMMAFALVGAELAAQP